LQMKSFGNGQLARHKDSHRASVAVNSERNAICKAGRGNWNDQCGHLARTSWKQCKEIL